MQPGLRTPSRLKIRLPLEPGVVPQDTWSQKLQPFPQAEAPVNILRPAAVPPSSLPSGVVATGVLAPSHREGGRPRSSHVSIASIFSDGGSIQVADPPGMSRARTVTWAESDTGSGVHQSVVSIPPYAEIYGIHPRLFNFGANGEILVGGQSTGLGEFSMSTIGQQLHVTQPLPQRVLQQTHLPSSVPPSCQPQQQGQCDYTSGGTLPVVVGANAEVAQLKDFVQRGTDTCKDSDTESMDEGEESDDPDVSGCFWFKCKETICHTG